MCDELHNPEETTETVEIKLCLNCGTELNGEFCHNCGQQASDTNSTVKGFVLEYVNNAFLWEPKHLKTMWLLFRKPGFLTKEFISGKYVSYANPLKLNMFILFVFITVFLLFSSQEKLNHSVSDFANDERVLAAMHLDVLQEDPVYVNKMKNSPRDTVQLAAPLLLAETHPNIITCLKVTEDTGGESLDKWTAILPAVLIEDKIFIPGENGFYSFNKEVGKELEDLKILTAVWQQLVDLMTRYFPMIVLLTAPFLSFSLRLTQIKHKFPKINNFIFSLHYTAFLEMLILFIYFVYLIAAPPIEVLQWVLIIVSCTYLTIAFHRAYEMKSWVKAMAKALFASFVYFIIILFLLIFNCFIACILAAIQLCF